MAQVSEFDNRVSEHRPPENGLHRRQRFGFVLSQRHDSHYGHGLPASFFGRIRENRNRRRNDPPNRQPQAGSQVASLNEQRLFLARQREIETAAFEELFVRGDRHDLQHAPLMRPLDALFHQPFADPRAAKVR